MGGEKRVANSKGVVTDNALGILPSRDIRQAHSGIQDEEFEQAKEYAEETETPLTRSFLKGKSAEKKQGGTISHQQAGAASWEISVYRLLVA